MPSTDTQTDLMWSSSRGRFLYYWQAEATAEAAAPATTAAPAVAVATTATTAAGPPTNYADPQLWPSFPPLYFQRLGEAACRWGCSKSYKYAVDAYDTEREALSQWVRYRFGLFLQERGLQNRFTHVGAGEFPRHNAITFEKYNFVRPPKTWPQQRIVYHGTYAECFARIAWTTRFISSDNNTGLGHECRTPFPAVFTAATIDHAINYAWPSNFLLDNLYYGIIFELAIDETRILHQRCGEVLVPPDAILINAVYLLVNMPIQKGGKKSPVWDPSLELLPSSMIPSQGRVANFVNHQHPVSAARGPPGGRMGPQGAAGGRPETGC